MAIITYYPDKYTIGYAQLWLKQPFVILANSHWWPVAPLPSEAKWDEWEIGYTDKIDIPGPCWIVVEGSALAQSGSVGKFLRAIEAADEAMLDSSPGAHFMPIYPGVNTLDFDDALEPEPGPQPEPEPQPDLPPVDEPGPAPSWGHAPASSREEPLPPEGWVPRIITFYGSHSAMTPFATRWGDDVVYVVPREWIVTAALNTMTLFEWVKDVPIKEQRL